MTNREYKVQGRNGYWAVDLHVDGESGTRGDHIILPTRKLAQQVADALNEAYQAGWSKNADV